MTSPRDVAGMMIRIQEIILTASLKATEWLWLSQIFSSWMPIEQHQKPSMKGVCLRVGEPLRFGKTSTRAFAPHYGVRQGRAAKVAAISQVDSRHVFKYSCVPCTSVPSFYACFFSALQQLRKIYEPNVAAKAKKRRESLVLEPLRGSRFSGKSLNWMEVSNEMGIKKQLLLGSKKNYPIMRQNSRIFQCCGWKNWRVEK